MKPHGAIPRLVPFPLLPNPGFPYPLHRARLGVSMNPCAPSPRFPEFRIPRVRFAFPALMLLLSLGTAKGRGADPGVLPPVPVSGLAGVTFQTADLASLRRFYGVGAGFAEAPSAIRNPFHRRQGPVDRIPCGWQFQLAAPPAPRDFVGIEPGGR